MASPEFLAEMEKADTKPLDKVEIILDAGTFDITEWFKGGAVFDQKREIAPDRISAGDTTFTFSNHDDKFTETKAGSLFYGVKYLNRKIRFSAGFILPDGSQEFEPQTTMIIKSVEYDFENSVIYISCMDLTKLLVDSKINIPPFDTLPVPGASNSGNGTCSAVKVKPFIAKNETWTLTCTTPGVDGVAIFSVVGSVSGNIGSATSGTEFSNPAVGGVKFTIKVGTNPWALNDTFSFKTYQFPEWTNKNPVKIIWSILTGTDYDTATDEPFKARTLQLDPTQSGANTQINWSSFVEAVGKVYTPITGYISRNSKAGSVIEGIHILFLGSTSIDANGKVKIRAFKPELGLIPRNFSATKKIKDKMRRVRDREDIINSVVVETKGTPSWAWSGESEVLDLLYSKRNTQSISDYKEERSLSFASPWLSVNIRNGAPEAQQWFADRIVDRYALPPTLVEFETGLDALLTQLGDLITITDDDAGLAGETYDVLQIKKDFVSAPKSVEISAANDTTFSSAWAYLGSNVDEGDGVSPQASTWDAASSTDKQFAYLSDGVSVEPRYYLF